MPPRLRRRTLEPANIVGRRVKHARESRSLTQEQCAKDVQTSLRHIYPGIEMEVDQSDISRIERGERPVWDYEVRAFSEVLGVSADWLLGLSDELGGA